MSQSEKPKSVSVEIYGQAYQIRSHEDPAHVQALGRMVNETMRAVEQATATVDTSRVAVLAALNLADELSKARSSKEAYLKKVELENNRLIAIIDKAIES